MILIIDNYDSFVHNLARYFELAGWEYKIVRNDRITVEEIKTLSPRAIALSPGPCTPAEAGICIDTVKNFGESIPMLGVCLGHQCIVEAYGGQTVRAKEPAHGKACEIEHDGNGVFDGLPSPMTVGRYHSLVTHLNAVENLKITARYDEKIMAIQHVTHPVYGVQFHPESVLTDHGQRLIDNFTTLALKWNKEKESAA